VDKETSQSRASSAKSIRIDKQTEEVTAKPAPEKTPNSKFQDARLKNMKHFLDNYTST